MGQSSNSGFDLIVLCVKPLFVPFLWIFHVFLKHTQQNKVTKTGKQNPAEEQPKNETFQEDLRHKYSQKNWQQIEQRYKQY